jgi:hypothetical protein
VTNAVYVYRLVVEKLPDGSGESGWEPPGWHKWCFENGYAEAEACNGATDEDGRPFDHMPFRWPHRKYFIHGGTANRAVQRFIQWGAVARVERSQRVQWKSTATARVDQLAPIYAWLFDEHYPFDMHGPKPPWLDVRRLAQQWHDREDDTVSVDDWLLAIYDETGWPADGEPVDDTKEDTNAKPTP